jgi:hypothetical protein
VNRARLWEHTSASLLILGNFAGDILVAVGVASRLADAFPTKRVLPIVTDFGAALEGAIVCKLGTIGSAARV